MTSRLLMPRRTANAGRHARPEHTEAVEGSTCPTRILDWRHPRITSLTSRVEETRPASPLDALRTAHGIIAREIRPVYSVDDRRRASRTLALGRGSCSQRMAVLEAVARASGVPTRVRGLLVDGSFWYPRFPRLKPLVPEQVLLAWPEFHVGGTWVPVGELFTDLHTDTGDGFANKGGETLFDAVARTGLRWDAPVSCTAQDDTCDLSAQVRVDLGHFTSRDALFTHHGPTLC
ncbi:transglutaminase domain-containing protein, partial [Streptomyces spongiae]